eukprot:Sspe_Gene.62023::Locus_34600_Transcript_1_1_Confidence_1.000_Length_994::g.62023::m.62023
MWHMSLLLLLLAGEAAGQGYRAALTYCVDASLGNTSSACYTQAVTVDDSHCLQEHCACIGGTWSKHCAGGLRDCSKHTCGLKAFKCQRTAALEALKGLDGCSDLSQCLSDAKAYTYACTAWIRSSTCSEPLEKMCSPAEDASGSSTYWFLRIFAIVGVLAVVGLFGLSRGRRQMGPAESTRGSLVTIDTPDDRSQYQHLEEAESPKRTPHIKAVEMSPITPTYFPNPSRTAPPLKAVQTLT